MRFDLRKLIGRGIDMEALDEESQVKRPAAPRTRSSNAARSSPNTIKVTENAKRTTRSDGNRKGTTSIGVNRSAKKKAVSPKTAAANSTRRTETGKPNPSKKK